VSARAQAAWRMPPRGTSISPACTLTDDIRRDLPDATLISMTQTVNTGSGNVKEQTINVEEKAGLSRETVRDEKAMDRHVIIGGLILTFGATIAIAFWLATTAHWTNVKELLDLILPAETALLGTAVAFYMAD